MCLSEKIRVFDELLSSCGAVGLRVQFHESAAPLRYGVFKQNRIQRGSLVILG